MAPLLFAASVTPLSADGGALDEDAIAPLAAELEGGGVDGIFALGTTGEGVLLTLAERRRAAERFREAVTGTLIVHAGAQSTSDTVALAAHAAAAGADAVAVIPPPYFVLDEAALVDHLAASAAACDPLPCYLYAFRARSGYAITGEVVRRVRERAGNIAGMKVSESPFDAVSPFLEHGLPVFVGNEPLIPAALAAGAAGAVSGLASAFPETVAAVVHDPSEDGAAELRTLRSALERLPFHAALKAVLRRRGVPLHAAVRRPLRGLTPAEEGELERLLGERRAAAPR